MTLDGSFDALRDYLKQIVFGGNDGIITTFAIVAGFAGAEAQGTGAVGAVAVLVFGLANLAADATSMGLGEFLSGRSNRDLYAARHADAKRAAQLDPDAAATAMAHHFEAQGLERQAARRTAEQLATAPDLMADLALRYDHGMEAPEASNLPMRAFMTFASFVAFGFIPILPFVLFPGGENIQWISVAATLTALALLGLLRFAVTGDRLWRAVGETVSLGALCAAIAYGTGLAVAGIG